MFAGAVARLLCLRGSTLSRVYAPTCVVEIPDGVIGSRETTT
jgi:hypothetical protein